MMKTDYLFEHEIANLKEAGIGLSDLTGAEIVALVRAVEKLRNPFSSCNADVVGMPIRVKGCDEVLWKLTVGATVWLAEYPRKWWLNKGEEKPYFWAVVYAAINARNSGAFIDLTDEFEAHTRITELALKLSAYEADLVEGINKAFEIRDTGHKRDERDPITQTDWATIIARIEGQSGIPADQWCWKRSADYVLRVHEDLKRFADIAAGCKPNRMHDEIDMATDEIAQLRAQIVERVRQDREAAK